MKHKISNIKIVDKTTIDNIVYLNSNAHRVMIKNIDYVLSSDKTDVFIEQNTTHTSKLGIILSFISLIGCIMLISYPISEIAGLIYALIALAILEYITSTISELINKSISEKTGLIVRFNKLYIFSLFIIAKIIDEKVIGGGDTIKTAVLITLLANESINIIDNIARAGLPIPKKIMDILKKIKIKR